MVVETVAPGLSMDPRPYAADLTRPADFLSGLMLMRATLPDTKLIFLHNTHDVVEQWDAIRHKPTLLEREIYSLSNVFRRRADGSLQQCADGFLVCLGDGLDEGHWEWLRQRWELAWSGEPQGTLGATVLWSNSLIEAQTMDFTSDRAMIAHRLLFEMMAVGAPLQTIATPNDLDGVTGALLVPNYHLLPVDELVRVISYKGGPLILIGPEVPVLREPEMRMEDRSGPGSLRCLVYGSQVAAPEVPAWDPPALPDDLMGLDEPMTYWEHFEFAPVSPGFIRACAEVITEVSGAPRVVEQAEDVVLMAQVEGARIRVALKNKSRFYATPRVDMRREIARVQVLTEFPSLTVTPQGSEFSVRIPPEGLTVVEVELG